jgi:hypothetical protein
MRIAKERLVRSHFAANSGWTYKRFHFSISCSDLYSKLHLVRCRCPLNLASTMPPAEKNKRSSSLPCRNNNPTFLGSGSIEIRSSKPWNQFRSSLSKRTSFRRASGASNNTLFHFDRAPTKQTALYWQRVKNVKTSLRIETAGRPNGANGNKNGGRFGESSNEKEISHGKR